MLMFFVRTFLAALIIGIVSEVSHRSPRVRGRFAYVTRHKHHGDHDDMVPVRRLKNLSQLSRETLILVPLGLPFIPLAFAGQIGLKFWPALATGLLLATVTVGGWLVFSASFQG